MNLRSEWRENHKFQESDRFYTKEETIENVQENFDIRRFQSAEGHDLDINGVIERCLVQTSSNPLRELNDYRKIHCPMTADVKRGYYVRYEDLYWIIDTNVVNVDGAYLSTRMSKCQYLLRWQNSDGEIVERWCYASDETKYSNGETGNNSIAVGDNQYGLIVPIDAETKKLKRGMRFPFDFDDADEPDIYELSNRKVKIKEGIMILSFSFDAFNEAKDRRVTLPSGESVWICDYKDAKSTVNETAISITGGAALRYGRTKTWTATFTDSEGNEVTDTPFTWNVVSNFTVSQTINGNKISLKVQDDSFIGESILLQIVSENKVLAETEITVTGGV